MKIPLNSFEQYIDETILKRGFQYFKKDLVHEPEDLTTGEYDPCAFASLRDIFFPQISQINADFTSDFKPFFTTKEHKGQHKGIQRLTEGAWCLLDQTSN